MSLRNRSRGRTRVIRPRVEALDPRLLLTIITVTGTGDDIANDGVVTLREAITAANTDQPSGDAPAGSPGANEIDFDIPGTGVHTITLTTNLPTITSPLTIDGFTQPGASPNTGATDQPDNAAMRIQLDSAQQVVGTAIEISASDCVVRGLSITNVTFFGDGFGIKIDPTSSGDRIEGDFLGVGPDGSTAGNDYNGVDVQGPNTTIGGEAAADRNLISGNKFTGVVTEQGGASDTLVEGNFIGVAADGVTALPNGVGVGLQGGSDSTIGGTASADRNVISGNGDYGVELIGGSARMQRAVIQGNYLGVDRTGTAALPNFGGIELIQADHTTIGGTAAGAGNIILASHAVGIEVGISGGADGTVIQGNAIGTDFAGTLTTGVQDIGIEATNSTNTLIGGTAPGAGNLIANVRPFGVGGVGIYTAKSGVSILDNSFFGNGGAAIYGTPNLSIPVLTSVTTTAIAGHFLGAANTLYHIEYFDSPDAGGASDQQARTLLGSRDATSDGSGQLDLAFSPPGGIPEGDFVNANVTAPDGTTSLFASAQVASPASSPPASADLVTTVSVAPGPVAPGSTLVYTITVTNEGPDAATDLSLNSTVPSIAAPFVSFTAPAGWTSADPSVGDPSASVSATSPTLAPGAANAAIFTLVLQVSPGASPGVLTDTFSAISTTPDPVASNNDAEANTTIAIAQDNAPTPQVAIAVRPDPAMAGDLLTYTIHVSNTGGAAAGGATLMLPLPSHTTFISLALPGGWQGGGPAVGSPGMATADAGVFQAGADATFTLVVKVDPGVAAGTVLTLTSHVDTNPSVNGGASADATTTLTAPAMNAPPAVAPSVPAPAGDTAGPRIVKLQRFGFHAQPTEYVLTFDEALAAVGANDVRNFRLTSSGADGRFGTRDDVVFALKSAMYDPIDHTILLLPKRLVPWRHQYQLIVRGLTDEDGRALDGEPGGVAVLKFDRRNLAGPSVVRSRAKPPSTHNAHSAAARRPAP